jgi:transposase
MAQKKYVVRLRPDERKQLTRLLKAGAAPARQLTRAHVLLLSDEGYPDTTIATMLHITVATVARTRAKSVGHDLSFALTERPRIGGQAKLNGEQVAHLVALACSPNPAGGVWTMRLLAARLVQLGVVASISDETVRRTLKKTNLNRGSITNGAFPK